MRHGKPDVVPTSGTEPSEDGGDATPVSLRHRLVALGPAQPEPSKQELPETVVLSKVDNSPSEATPQVRVRLVASLPNLRAFQASDTLVIDRQGVLVDASAVPSLVKSAAKAGIVLEVGNAK